MKRRLLALSVLLFLSPFFHALAVADESDLATQIDAFAKPYVESGLVVGMVVGVVQDGKTQVFAYGRIAKDGEATPDEDTVYEIGSITKVFTGILLADLVREGKVRLDQPVQELLPDGVVVPKHGDREITLLDLATHTSGLPRMPSNFAPADVKNPYADYDAATLYAYLSSASLDAKPGTKSAYSNLGMGLLGHALARVAETDYETLLRTRILEPLGMKSSTITLSDDHRARLAPGHDALLAPAANWDLDAFAGAGAIRSTTSDMLRFVQANLDPECAIREDLDLAMKFHFESGGARMGLGWHAGQGGRGRFHNGQTGGYHAFLGLRRKEGIGVVVLANTATMEVDALGRAIEKVLLGEKVDTPPLRPAVAVDPETLDDYPGTYRLAPSFAIEVSLEGDQLYVQATGQPRVPVYAAGEDRFFLRVVKAEIAFARDEEGKVSGLVLHQNGREMPGVRE